MGKAAILIVSAFVIFGSMYAFSAEEEAANADQRLGEYQYGVLARNAALAGYNVARQQLADDFDTAAPSASGEHSGGRYATTIKRNGSVASIRSVGSIERSDGVVATFTIQAEVEREVTVETHEDVPPFMTYALIAEDDLDLGGDISVDAYVDGQAGNTLNANVHSNRNLSVTGNSAVVRGFGTYVNNAYANPAKALFDTFDPYYNPTDDPVVERVPPIEIPAFDAVEFLAKVDVDATSGGDVQLSGHYDLGGTREDPYVWHVTGSLSATGGVTIDGYVMLVVEGDADLGGNVSTGSTGYEGADESSIAVYAAGAVTMRGNAEVFGQVFAGSSVSFMNGTPTVYGSVATAGSVVLQGTPNILYRAASPALTSIFEDPDIRLNLISYSEW